MNIEKQKFVIEKLGLCWHEWYEINDMPPIYLCSKCGDKVIEEKLYPDLETPDGMVWLANKLTYAQIRDIYPGSPRYMDYMKNPALFLEDVANYFGWEAK